MRVSSGTMKLLLTSVFGPYGVDDEYGRKENLMEVLHNQVTHAPKAKAYAKTVHRQYNEYFGKRPLKVRVISTALQAMILKEKIRSRLVYNNMRQPSTRYTAYRL